MTRRFRARPFGSAPFRWLLAARTTSILGNSIAPLALAFAVLDLTGSVSALGLVVAARSLAGVAMLLFGGVIADRLPRHLVLVGSSMVAAITQGIVASLVITGTATVPLLIVLSAVNGAVAAIGFPASSALISQTVPADQLRPANTLLRLSLNSASVVGASLGGVLVAAVGPGFGLVIDAASFAVAAILFAFVRTGHAPAKATVADGEPASSSVLRDLREGWTAFSSRRWLWAVVAQFAFVNAAFVGAVAVLGPVIADAHFGRASWGFVLAAETVGLVVGGLLALRFRPRHALRIGVALITITALPAFALATAPRVPVLLVVFFLGGVAVEQFGIAWDLSLQQHIPSTLLARVYSYDALGSMIAVPVGEALVGPISHVVGIQPTLLGCAGIIVVATIAALGVRGVRQLQSRPPAEDGAVAVNAGA